MADRCVMMSNGPLAGVGEILEIDFPRPRNRTEIFQDPKFFEYREHLLAFLEQRAHLKTSSRTFSNGNTMGYTDKKGSDLEVAAASLASSVNINRVAQPTLNHDRHEN